MWVTFAVFELKLAKNQTGMAFMSSPLDQDFGSDQLSLYAPKWVRRAAHAERRSMAPKFPEGIGDAQQMAATPAASDQPLAIDGHRLPPSLEPSFMPDVLGSPAGLSLAVLVRVAVAILIVATVALLVLDRIPIPWKVSANGHQESAPSSQSISGPGARTAEQPKTLVPQLTLGQQGPRPAGEAIPLGASLTGPAEGANIVLDGLVDGSMVTVGRSFGTNTWRIPVSDLNNALVHPPKGYAGSMDLVIELRLTDDTLADRKSLRFEWTGVIPSQINPVPQPPADLKQMFDQFVENYTTSTGKETFSAREREILFAKFQQYLNSQISMPSTR